MIAVGASLGVLAPPALAAPVNDQFANPTDLGRELPVHLTESNAGATRDGTLDVGSFAKGHSIWWKWEAPTTQWTTVDTCGSEFPTVVGVFEGSELDYLKRLSEGNAAEGPQCWGRGTTFTFWAEAGKSYDIAADGNGFYLPPQEPPSGEGNIALTIEATPPPPNDAFGDATPIAGSISEESSGRRLSWMHVTGYNWGATTEAGEPDLGGGASVWYSWTPPESGEVDISTCCGNSPELLTLFAGDSLGGLAPIASRAANAIWLNAKVTGGTRYAIEVAGAEDPSTLKPVMGSFGLTVDLELPPGPGDAWELIGGETVVPRLLPTTQSTTPNASATNTHATRSAPPATVLGRHTVDAATDTASFEFSSTMAGATFRCKLDREPFRTCASPLKLRDLKPGKHLLKVVAGADGRSDPTPAVARFTVPVPQRHHHRSR